MGGIRLNPLTGQLDLVGGSGGGPSPAAKYSTTFNATSDWGSPSGGYYTITVLASTHNVGASPIVEIFETILGEHYSVMPDEIKINGSGDVIFRVPETPDLRFAGKITII